MRRLPQILLLVSVSFATAGARADLLITTGPKSAEVAVQHCDARATCAAPKYISRKQFKVITKQVSRMSSRRLITMGATLRAMPFTPAEVFNDYTTYREASGRLKRLLKNELGGSFHLNESAAGADRIVDLFDRAVAARARNPSL